MQAYVTLHEGTPQQYTVQTDSPENWKEGKRVTIAEGKRRLKAEAQRKLLEIIKPGDTVQCVLRHVSRSGMYRRISFFAVDGADLLCLDRWILDLGLGESRKGDGVGVGVGGCGMDMGFSVVYDLGATLWPNGTPQPHGTRNGEPDSAGGYALKHRWV